jgi:hypothetical protein
MHRVEWRVEVFPLRDGDGPKQLTIADLGAAGN